MKTNPPHTKRSGDTKRPTTTALVVLDGWGYREDATHNAVAAAKTPFFDKIWKECPHSLLQASGLAVGLPEGQMGNSEVGHSTIGAGAIIDTDLVRIDKAATAGEFLSNPAMKALYDHVKKHQRAQGASSDAVLHVMGLVSDGGVHSHESHLRAFLKAAHQAGVPRIAVHVFTDGRDTAPQSAGGFVKKLEADIARLDPSSTNIFIASVSGRYFAMDRDSNWDRLAKAEAVMFGETGTGDALSAAVPSTKHSASAHLDASYAAGIKDEWLEPVIIEGVHGRGCPIRAHDAVFFFNFRSDRARMLCSKLIERIAKHRAAGADLKVATMTEYSQEYTFPVAFRAQAIETTLAAEISAAGLTQAHIAETEKFPHATYFLNGGRNAPWPGESHIGLETRKDVKTHDQAPEMRAEAIADKAIEQVAAGADFIFINFANPDIVGHTANVPAIITAVETVDTQLGRFVTALEKAGGCAIIIADHGNAEVNVDPVTGLPHTSHTTNLVPCILAGDISALKAVHPNLALKDGGLADVAPTILDIMKLQKPQPMTGMSLIA